MGSWKELPFLFSYEPNSGVEGTPLNVLVDLDGDGDLDLITPGFRFQGAKSYQIKISLNDGHGVFKEATSQFFPNGAPRTFQINQAVIGDFNGDGRPDVFLADTGRDTDPYPGARNTLLLSAGKHGLVNATNRLPAVSDYTHGAAAGDIDGDHDLDLLALNTFGGTPRTGPKTAPYFLINDGAGHFTRADDLLPEPVRDRETEFIFTHTAIFDANNDRHPDLFLGAALSAKVVTHPEDFRSYILLNDGHGDFSEATPIALPGPPFPVDGTVRDVSAFDVNADGNLDLVLFIRNAYTNHYMQILMGDGTGHFTDETKLRFPHIAKDEQSLTYWARPADFNRDGFVDVVDTDPFMINDGTGHFIRLPNPFPTSDHGHYFIDVHDFNRDGRLDVLVLPGDGNDYEFDYVVYLQLDPGANPTGTPGVDGLLGDASKETLSGLAGNDVIFAAAGNDTLNGGLGNDYLNGGKNNDAVNGDDGTDTLVGGLGADNLTGGTGKDFFKLNSAKESPVGAARDIVRDFSRAQHDRIDLSFIDPNATKAGDQKFIFIGAQSFANYRAANPDDVGLLRFSGGVLSGDVNDNGVADFEIKVIGTASLGLGDLIL